MLDRIMQSWFYPKPTGDPGRDRNARTLQFSCFLLAFAVGAVLIVSAIGREWQQTPLLVSAITGLLAAMVMNRAGRSDWAGRTAFLVVLLSAILLVFQAHDGFRSHSMLIFPGLLIISLMMLDRASYATTAGIVVVAVAALGIAVKDGITRATPPLRTTYDSIFYVDLNMLVIAIIGSRIARDTQSNVLDLCATIDLLLEANLGLRTTTEALRESEERFRNMADAAPVMIWVTGADKRATFFNKRCLEFTGHTMQEKLGDGWISALHPDDREWYLGVFSSSIDKRQEFQSVFRLRRADGEYRWLLCTGVPCFAAGGVYSGYIGSCIDITDQKLIEERLRASEIQLKDAQRLAKVGSWERNTDTDKIYWSDEVARIFGLPNPPPSNFANFLQRVHAKDREKVAEASRLVRSSQAPVETEYRIVRSDGEVLFVRSIVEAVRNDEGVVIRVVGATQDVSDEVHAREHLRESERRLKNAERLAHVGHWQWDLKNNTVSWSEEMYEILGQMQDCMPSYEAFVQAVVPEDRVLIEQIAKRRIEEKVGSSVEFRIVRPDKRVRTVKSISEVLVDGDGQPAVVFGACQDITDTKRAQEESFAKQKLESVGTLANGIAHDFNNILGAVVAQAELAQAECTGGSYPEGELKAIRDVAMRGSEIVRQLMVYSGKESPVVAPVDVSQIVKEMIDLLKLSVSKRATITTNLDEHLSFVRGNASQISQLVMNLVTNASEATGDRDGTIHVTTRRMIVEHDSPQIARLAPGEYVQLEVSDTGCGMPPKTQARVFDPFFSTKSSGRGLGLAVVQGIVRNLGGEVHLTSEPGQGTTVQISLPAAQTTAAGTMQELTSDIDEKVRQFRAPTILLVEDEDSLRQAVSKMLSKQGFFVIEAPDGSAALDAILAQQNSIDILFLDITLPRVPSREILSEARRVRPEMRVIATSAYNEEMTAALLQGTTERFIRKPYRFSGLLNVFQEVLS